MTLQVLDSLEREVEEGGCVLDFHTCDMFPESWIDLVVVLQTDHTVLWNRLEARYVARYFTLMIGGTRYRRFKRIMRPK